MRLKKLSKSIIELLNIVKENYSLELFFVLFNLINGLILRINTVNNPFRLSPLLIDLSFLILVSLLPNKIKEKTKTVRK